MVTSYDLSDYYRRSVHGEKEERERERWKEGRKLPLPPDNCVAAISLLYLLFPPYCTYSLSSERRMGIL